MVQYAGKKKEGEKQHASQFVQDQKKRGECKCLMWFGRVSSSGCAPTELKAALFERATIEFAVIEILKLDKSSKF